MKISQEADYALRIIYYLGQQKEGIRCDAKSIAETISLPQRFAVKILRKLNMAGFTKSYRGAYGGYVLSRQPEEISFLDIIECIDGKICLNKCLMDPEHCSDNRKGECYVRNQMLHVNQIIVAELKQIHFTK